MKVCVATCSRGGGKQPARLCLGRCSLPVAAVLDCRDEGGARWFTVRVLDGRRFVLRLHTESDQWDLVTARGRTAAQPAPIRHPMLPLLAFLALALSRNALRLAKRAGRWVVGHHPSALPGGGAPA